MRSRSHRNQTHCEWEYLKHTSLIVLLLCHSSLRLADSDQESGAAAPSPPVAGVIAIYVNLSHVSGVVLGCWGDKKTFVSYWTGRLAVVRLLDFWIYGVFVCGPRLCDREARIRDNNRSARVEWNYRTAAAEAARDIRVHCSPASKHLIYRLIHTCVPCVCWVRLLASILRQHRSELRRFVFLPTCLHAAFFVRNYPFSSIESTSNITVRKLNCKFKDLLARIIDCLRCTILRISFWKKLKFFILLIITFKLNKIN